MNKQKLFVSVILFFCALCFLSPCKVVYAQNFAENYKLSVLCEGKIKNFSLNSQNGKKRSQIFDKILSEKGETGLFQTLEKFDLTDEEKVKYFFPEIVDIETKIKSLVEVEGQNAGVFVVKNSCQIRLENPTPPRFLNTQKFYADIFNQMIAGKREFFVKAEIITGRLQNINSKFVQKSFFETDFSSSLAERKNNIKLALSKFDGLNLEPGESFSFNQVTGRRNEESGYAQAKIISGGTFVQGFGGGVCQVSTTIYNACLLAGLEILEVHPHSLPVSYVEPGFDAMVNFSSSDLVVRNNTEGTIIFATSGRNDKCKVKIFGLAGENKIIRKSIKTKIIPKGENIVDEDYSKYQNLNLEVGESKTLSVAKDGFCTESYLEFYDNFGNFIKKVKIRENTYNSTKGLTVKRKN